MADIVELLRAYPLWARIAVIAFALAIALILLFAKRPPPEEGPVDDFTESRTGTGPAMHTGEAVGAIAAPDALPEFAVQGHSVSTMHSGRSFRTYGYVLDVNDDHVLLGMTPASESVARIFFDPGRRQEFLRIRLGELVEVEGKAVPSADHTRIVLHTATLPSVVRSRQSAFPGELSSDLFWVNPNPTVGFGHDEMQRFWLRRRLGLRLVRVEESNLLLSKAPDSSFGFAAVFPAPDLSRARLARSEQRWAASFEVHKVSVRDIRLIGFADESIAARIRSGELRGPTNLTLHDSAWSRATTAVSLPIERIQVRDCRRLQIEGSAGPWACDVTYS